jgi:hypothetical protein
MNTKHKFQILHNVYTLSPFLEKKFYYPHTMEYSILNALQSLMVQYSMYYAEEIFKNTIAILKD